MSQGAAQQPTLFVRGTLVREAGLTVTAGQEDSQNVLSTNATTWWQWSSVSDPRAVGQDEGRATNRGNDEHAGTISRKYLAARVTSYLPLPVYLSDCK